MNPFTFVRDNLFTSVPSGVEKAALFCLLTAYASSYSSGFTRGPGNNEFDYVCRELVDDFGDNPAVIKLRQILQGKLGQ